MIRETLEYLSQGLDMTEDHAFRLMNRIMDGECTPAQIAGLLIALKMKGETVSELTGFVKAMRAKAVKIRA
ncbi:MAG: anthranilate phosphoribosyltransferase, partial [candidate division KSB1 bacterium]|nr:anthranilate phosphoribosyltransferase [candidate division KSB1 bacterium]